jgi:cell division protein FtsX
MWCIVGGSGAFIAWIVALEAAVSCGGAGYVPAPLAEAVVAVWLLITAATTPIGWAFLEHSDLKAPRR